LRNLLKISLIFLVTLLFTLSPVAGYTYYSGYLGPSFGASSLSYQNYGNYEYERLDISYGSDRFGVSGYAPRSYRVNTYYPPKSRYFYYDSYYDAPYDRSRYSYPYHYGEYDSNFAPKYQYRNYKNYYATGRSYGYYGGGRYYD